MTLRIALLSVLAVVAAGRLTAAAPDATLDEARGLYESAQYERALETLVGLESEEIPNPDRQALRRYKALCLIALDRTGDAERTLEELVRADPAAAPGNDAPPRMQELMLAVRKKLAPVIAREKYERGRDFYERGRLTDAQRELTSAIAIIDDASVAASTTEGLADLKLLADGFLKLATATSAVANAPATNGLSASASGGANAAPGASAASSATRPGGTAAAPATQPEAFVPPRAIVQPVPPYTPAMQRTTISPRDGEIEVTIGTDGRVSAARTTVSITPAFDKSLIETAQRDWRYEPARRDGVPVPWNVRVKIALKR